MLRTLLLLSAALLFTVGCSTPTVTASPASPPPSYAGLYDLTVQNTPGGTVTGTLTLLEDEEGLSGTLSASGATTDLRTVTQTEDGITITFYSREYQTDVTMRLTGAPGAATLEGRTLGEYPTTAVRK